MFIYNTLNALSKPNADLARTAVTYLLLKIKRRLGRATQ